MVVLVHSTGVVVAWNIVVEVVPSTGLDMAWSAGGWLIVRLVDNGTGVLVAEGPYDATAAGLRQVGALGDHIGCQASAVDIGNMVAGLAHRYEYS